jgi:hypothetical protein
MLDHFATDGTSSQIYHLGCENCFGARIGSVPRVLLNFQQTAQHGLHAPNNVT